jgi:hypothetical protein
MCVQSVLPYGWSGYGAGKQCAKPPLLSWEWFQVLIIDVCAECPPLLMEWVRCRQAVRGASPALLGMVSSLLIIDVCAECPPLRMERVRRRQAVRGASPPPRSTVTSPCPPRSRWTRRPAARTPVYLPGCPAPGNGLPSCFVQDLDVRIFSFSDLFSSGFVPIFRTRF